MTENLEAIRARVADDTQNMDRHSRGGRKTKAMVGVVRRLTSDVAQAYLDRAALLAEVDRLTEALEEARAEIAFAHWPRRWDRYPN